MNEQTAKVVEIRSGARHYYAGTLTLEIDPHELEPATIHWIAYEGGSVKLTLDWGEIEALHSALGELVAAKPEWA